jgi:prophage regulatory protein
VDANDRLLTVTDVEQTVGYCKVTIYKMIREGRFPMQIHLGPNKVAWLRSEILEWIDQKATARHRAEQRV